MRGKQSLLIVAIMVATLVSRVSIAHSQQPVNTDGCTYFNQTGHFVCGAFLLFYEERGGFETFGDPLTRLYTDPATGLEIQFFQNARMEYHPENPASYRVQTGLLVDELGYSFPKPSADQIPAFNNDLNHYFLETGYVVSYGFLDYFRSKGGLDIFGYPRSQFMYEEGRVVQYFQRARVEWHPDAPEGSQMQMTPLGELYIERIGVLPGVTDREDPEYIVVTKSITQLHASATVRYTFTARDGRQTVFVYVTDQQEVPVQGAVVSMIVRYPSGDQEYQFNGLTNENGFAGHSFDILPTTLGQKVVIVVTVRYNDLSGETETFFMQWL